MPTAISTLYCDADDLAYLASQEGVDLRLDDNEGGTVSAAELVPETRALNYATGRINDFALARYTAADLATSWTVNWWATVIALRYLCARRLNSVNKQLQAMYKEVMEDLQGVKNGSYTLGDTAERVVSSPAYKNIRVPVWYRLRRMRVERPISDSTPTRLPETPDRVADAIGNEY